MENNDIWSKNNSLYFYGNEDTIDDLIFRIYGELIDSVTSSEKKSGKLGVGVKAKFGSILSLFGLGEVEGNINGDLSMESAKSFVKKISFEGKLNSIIKYFTENDEFPYIDSHKGVILIRSNKPIKEWEEEELNLSSNSFFGEISGLYRSKRIYPEDTYDKANMGMDFMKEERALWEFETISSSNIMVTVPIVIQNIRKQDMQTTAGMLFSRIGLRIVTIGLLNFENKTVRCNPIAIRFFY